MPSYVGPSTEDYASFNEANPSLMDCPSHEVALVEDDLDIQWSELVLKQNIGTGTIFETSCIYIYIYIYIYSQRYVEYQLVLHGLFTSIFCFIV